MSKILEYAIMIFMAGLLLILFRWSENGHYQVNDGTSAPPLIDTRTGNAWFPNSNELIRPPRN
ncbi:MAG: hypothetical protein IIC40_08695 [Candidatus Marinimicrobia bacterium]|nr:hypothetical protein [Candidatus Neomarinimicrobiota bacterium]